MNTKLIYDGENTIFYYNTTKNNIYNLYTITNEKPELSFDFDRLDYEPIIEVYRKSLNNNLILLSDEEKEECYDYCQDIIKSGDLLVYAYDTTDDINIYMGNISISDCKKNGYKYTTVQCDKNIVWFDKTELTWQDFYGGISKDGILTIENVLYEKMSIYFKTKEDFEKFPKRENEHFVWDFDTNQWTDKRILEDEKTNALEIVRGIFENIRIKNSGGYVEQFEEETWIIQYLEATKYLKDKTSETPYIDTFLENRTDKYIPTKDQLVQDIINNYNNFAKENALISAKFWSYKKNIENAKTCVEIDEIIKDIENYFNTNYK